MPALSPKLFFIVIPIITPALYVVWVDYSLSRKISTSTSSGPKAQKEPSKPEDVPSDSQALVFHESASKAIPSEKLKLYGDTGSLLTAYMCSNMKLFTSTPQAFLIRRMIASPEERISFEASYLEALTFQPGDRVCGVYVVSRRKDSKIELRLSTPSSYRGPVFQGILVITIEERGGQTVFLNDVWLWRRKGEPRVPIEGTVGRWMHLLFAKWLIEKATKAVTTC
jgi:hypothetical protein